MSAADAAEQSLKNGDPAAALAHLQEQVRARPADPKLRVFLFQLLCVVGQWDRALNQLKVAADLDAGALAMAQTYGDAVRCESIRREVFEGRKSPMVFGEPEQWLALLIESLLLAGRGDRVKSEEYRLQAFDEADASGGEIDGQPFTWICDADSRLGPVLEAVINGRYYWVPFSRLSRVTLEAPEDLRDMVWMPAQLQFENGGEAVALIPTRYQGSETAADGLIALARKTLWEEIAPDNHHGLGQRIIATDAGDVPLMEIRSLSINRQADGAFNRSALIMAEQLPPQERLQPVLLDRLTDDEPDKKLELREQRVLSKSRMRQAVLRDLAWLFNATRLDAEVDFTGAPYARQSVINFGLPSLSGRLASSLEVSDLERAVRQAILDFEPRILPNTLRVNALVELSELDHHNVIGIQIQGQLWAQPVPLDLLVRTEIDLETGKVQIADLTQSRVP